jgi:AraC-like DNA-binding protein
MNSDNADSIKKSAHGACGRFPVRGIAPCPALSPKIWRVTAYLDHSFAQPITLREAASVVDLHPDYLSRRFKCEMGMGFHEYLLTLRLRRATTLLVTSTKSIKEIGYDVGFHAPEVFSKAFKRAMGCAPTTYRIHNLPFYAGLTAPVSGLALIADTAVSSMGSRTRSDLVDHLSDCGEEP